MESYNSYSFNHKAHNEFHKGHKEPGPRVLRGFNFVSFVVKKTTFTKLPFLRALCGFSSCPLWFQLRVLRGFNFVSFVVKKTTCIKPAFPLALLLIFAFQTQSQTLSDKEKHDAATETISDVLFDSKAKPIRDRLKTFENGCGIKIQYRVEDASLNELGGLSEHLFKLFQNFTTTQNTNVKTITAEFSVLDHNSLSNLITYKTNATSDLASCVLPLKDTHKLDSLYTRGLQNAPVSVQDRNEVPASLDELYPQAIDAYEKILYKNNSCPNAFNTDAYNQHVINTRQNRFTDWTGDASNLSLNLSANYGNLTSNSPPPNTSNNNGNTAVNLNIDPALLSGQHILNLNNSVNTCTKKDMEARCRLLYAKTGIRFLFLTQDLNYYLPTDSMTKFRDAATQSFTTNLTDDIIVALYLKMKDPSTNSSTGILLVKQINGSWLTQADIHFASYNNGGAYTAGTFSRFKNVLKNIPKPLILCYQVAKVNGLLTTAYFNKGEKVKGREQIYYHAFKIDVAFEEIGQLHSQLAALYAQGVSSGGGVIGANAITTSSTYREIDELKNKIRIAYLKAAAEPKFKEAEQHYKEIYLQRKTTAEAAALKYLRDKYGLLYKNNQFDALIANVGLPEDVTIGSCEAGGGSDVVADALNISSLILSPVGLDFIPDALAVAYFASTDNTYEMLMASASFLVPGSLSGIKKTLSSTTDIFKEINAGNKLLVESGQLSAIEQDVNYISAMFNISPQNVDAALVSKINNNPTVTDNLLPITAAQANIYSNTEKLDPPKRLEFVKKCYDDPDFRNKVLLDPEEVLKWGGVIELVRGVSKTDFMSSVTEFASNTALAEQAWTHFKNENWNLLEDLFKNNNLNGGWPPNRGFISTEIVELPVNMEFDRYGGYISNGVFKDNGSFVAPINLPFPERALPASALDKPYNKYKVIKPIPGVTKGPAIPWFNQTGLGLQYEFPQNYGIDFLLENGYIQKIN